ncbi:hypothetical protein BT63DRAFT_350390, partial [Microthyrium microscopicum]
MAWEHLDINKPHLVYIILGGFTSIFMLCSSIIKEKLYIGEATVATLCGIIFGPIAANLINPLDWGNTDQITLEFSRIVLVVQCFAVGVELPKAYMERHWKSVTLLLIPVMTFGWLMTSLFIWWMFLGHLNWLDSLCIAACVTATDPVLASSVVGKGKFAKRVPKHLRDLLSAESGCNDGMAFPFIYLSIYLIRYKLAAGPVAFHFIAYTVLYECIFGAVYGVAVGYGARRAIRYAHDHDLVDRESFLVFYFVLALFCAGSGSILGIDDLLVGFACGVGFSNDGWFQEKTEETHVSNVIDLLINLAFFVYFGTIIPWAQFSSDATGITPWRLVVVAIFVILFRRIPIMMMLKPIIPDIKTWREALFAGHFGPIGVGAIFVAILARAELENETTTPLAKLPKDNEHYNIIAMIWPITTFLVLTSIIIHGSSIAVFTLGKHINTLTLTFSYTTAVEDGPNWMDRLPRIATSRSKSSMSLRRPGESSQVSLDEKNPDGTPLSPSSIPRNFLRRQQEEDNPSRSSSRAGRKTRKRRWDTGRGPGGPISQSAITPASRLRNETDTGDLADQDPSSDTEQGSPQSPSPPPQDDIYQEGQDFIVEDQEGEVVNMEHHREGESEGTTKRRAQRDAQENMERDLEKGLKKAQHEQDKGDDHKAEEHRPHRLDWRHRMGSFAAPFSSRPTAEQERERRPTLPTRETRHGPARAYTFGNTVIVEDEDGEVIKTYQIPSRAGVERHKSTSEAAGKGTRDMLSRMGMQRMGTYFGANPTSSAKPQEQQTGEPSARQPFDVAPTEDDEGIRFTLAAGGPRLKKKEFIQQLAKMDTRTRAHVVDKQDTSDGLKREVHRRA